MSKIEIPLFKKKNHRLFLFKEKKLHLLSLSVHPPSFSEQGKESATGGNPRVSGTDGMLAFGVFKKNFNMPH
jgi:hypothetical protein